MNIINTHMHTKHQFGQNTTKRGARGGVGRGGRAGVGAGGRTGAGAVDRTTLDTRLKSVLLSSPL